MLSNSGARKDSRVPWTARRSNQLILKKINPEYPLEGLMLKLKLQYLGHLMRRANSLEETLLLGKIEDRRRRGWQDEMVGWHHSLNGHKFEQTPGDNEEQGTWCVTVHGVAKSGTQLSNWTIMTSLNFKVWYIMKIVLWRVKNTYERETKLVH